MYDITLWSVHRTLRMDNVKNIDVNRTTFIKVIISIIETASVVTAIGVSSFN